MNQPSFTFTGVVKAPFYKDGEWKNDLDSPAPLGELESDVVRLYHAEEEP